MLRFSVMKVKFLPIIHITFYQLVGCQHNIIFYAIFYSQYSALYLLSSGRSKPDSIPGVTITPTITVNSYFHQSFMLLLLRGFCPYSYNQFLCKCSKPDQDKLKYNNTFIESRSQQTGPPILEISKARVIILLMEVEIFDDLQARDNGMPTPSWTCANIQSKT